MALFEYRRYEAVRGKLPALHHRFENITMGYFKKHGIAVVGFWDAGDRHQQRAPLPAAL
jgi:hypothetical protein